MSIVRAFIVSIAPIITAGLIAAGPASAAGELATHLIVLKDGEVYSTSGCGNFDGTIKVGKQGKKSVAWLTFQTGGFDGAVVAGSSLTLHVSKVSVPGTLKVFALAAPVPKNEGQVAASNLNFNFNAPIASIPLTSADCDKLIRLNLGQLLSSGSFYGLVLGSTNGLAAEFNSKDSDIPPAIELRHTFVSSEQIQSVLAAAAGLDSSLVFVANSADDAAEDADHAAVSAQASAASATASAGSATQSSASATASAASAAQSASSVAASAASAAQSAGSATQSATSATASAASAAQSASSVAASAASATQSAASASASAVSATASAGSATQSSASATAASASASSAGNSAVEAGNQASASSSSAASAASSATAASAGVAAVQNSASASAASAAAAQAAAGAAAAQVSAAGTHASDAQASADEASGHAVSAHNSALQASSSASAAAASAAAGQGHATAAAQSASASQTSAGAAAGSVASAQALVDQITGVAQGTVNIIAQAQAFANAASAAAGQATQAAQQADSHDAAAVAAAAAASGHADHAAQSATDANTSAAAIAALIQAGAIFPPGTILMNLNGTPFTGFSATGLRVNYELPWGPTNAPAIARSEMASVVSGGRLYVAGGTTGAVTIATVQAFNPPSATWITLTGLPFGIRRASMVEKDGKLYLLGGLDGTGNAIGTCLRYDIGLNAWTSIASMPARWGHASAYFDGKIYVFGGYSNAGMAHMTATSVYDIATDSWSTGSPLPTWRALMQAREIGGRIYVMGGSLQGPFTAVNEAYDPAADSWATLAPLPGGRANYGAVADNARGRIYVMGGETIGATNSCLQYEVAANSWVQVNSMNQARHSMAIGLIDGKIFASQGIGTANLSTTEEYLLPKTVYLMEKL
jgi:Kelch motif protein